MSKLYPDDPHQILETRFRFDHDLSHPIYHIVVITVTIIVIVFIKHLSKRGGKLQKRYMAWSVVPDAHKLVYVAVK